MLRQKSDSPYYEWIETIEPNPKFGTSPIKGDILNSRLEALMELFRKKILGWSPGDRCLPKLKGSFEKKKSG